MLPALPPGMKPTVIPSILKFFNLSLMLLAISCGGGSSLEGLKNVSSENPTLPTVKGYTPNLPPPGSTPPPPSPTPSSGTAPGSSIRSISREGITYHDPHPVLNAATDDQLNAHFAANIQPILQGVHALSTAQNTCIACHVDGRFGMTSFQTCQQPFSKDDVCIKKNRLQFFVDGDVYYPNLEASKVLAVLRGQGVKGQTQTPGKYHMNNNFIPQNATALHTIFKQWLTLERNARAPELIPGAAEFACAIYRPHSHWNDRPYFEGSGQGQPRFGRPGGGPSPKLLCHPLDTENNRLVGAPVDITALVTPALQGGANGFDLERLVVKEVTDQSFTLFTSIREARGNMNNRYNPAKIVVTLSNGQITAAARSYLIGIQYYNQGVRLARVDENGQMINRVADDFVNDILHTRSGDYILVESTRGLPTAERLAPCHPDPANYTRQDPRLECSAPLPESYHGGQGAKQLYAIAETGPKAGIPVPLVPTHGNLVEYAQVDLGGRIILSKWENALNPTGWVAQFYPDTTNFYVAENLPPIINKGGPDLRNDHHWGQLAIDPMGQIWVPSDGEGLEEGSGVIQLVNHEYGIPFKPPLPDQAPTVQILRETNLQAKLNCEGGQQNIVQGIDRDPSIARDGRMLVVYSSKPYNQCPGASGALNPPTDLGFGIVDHTNARRLLYNPETNPGLFSEPHFVSHAVSVHRRQKNVLVEFPQYPPYSAVHIPHVGFRNAMKMRQRSGIADLVKNAQFSWDTLTVLQQYPNPVGSADMGVWQATRLGGAGFIHSNPAGPEKAYMQFKKGDLPTQADGSIAFLAEAGVQLALQYKTTLQTPYGPIKFAVRGEDMFTATQPGFIHLSSPLNENDYIANCARCHGSSDETVKTIEQMTRNPQYSVHVNRTNTLAMQNPVDLTGYRLRDPASPLRNNFYFIDYSSRLERVFEAKCASCHSGANPPKGLDFSRAWHPSASPAQHPSGTLPYTSPFYPLVTLPPQFQLTGQLMGATAPWVPGMVQLLEKVATNKPGGGWPYYLGTQGNTAHISHGPNTFDYQRVWETCSILFATLGVPDINCPRGVQYFAGQSFTPPAGHAGLLTRDELQALAEVIDTKWMYGYGGVFDPAPGFSYYAGQNRVGLFLESSQ